MTCFRCGTPLTFGKPHYCSHGQPYSLSVEDTAEVATDAIHSPAEQESSVLTDQQEGDSQCIG